MSCEYCEEGRTLFASAEGRACDIDDISVERLCVLGKEGPAKEPYVIGISLYNGDYCYTKDISYCPMCGAKLGGDGGMGGCEVGARLDRRTLQGHAGGLVQTVRWIAASCAALLVAVVALELYAIRMLAAGLVVLALLACG